MIGLIVNTDIIFDLYGIWSERTKNILTSIFILHPNICIDYQKALVFNYSNSAYIILPLLELSHIDMELVNNKYGNSVEIKSFDTNYNYGDLLFTVPDSDATYTYLSDFLEYNSSISINLSVDIPLEDVTVQFLYDNFFGINLQVSPVFDITSKNFLSLSEKMGSDPIAFLYMKCCKIIRNDKLTGMVRYYLKENGESDIFYPNIHPIKCTRLELESQIQKINQEIFSNIKSLSIWYRLQTVFEKATYTKNNLDNCITGLISELLFNNIAFTDSKSDTMWIFTEDSWNIQESGWYLWNFISTQLPKYICLQIKSGSWSDEQVKTLEHISRILESVPLRKRLFYDTRMKLFDGSLIAKLNHRIDIIGMANGTYELNLGKIRKPIPDDYISMKTSVELPIVAPLTQIQILMNILKQIFPREDLLKFFIRSCASMLEGYNSHKVYYIWWGTGNNAKTVTQTLISKTLGDYSVSLPTSLITGKRASSTSATPDMCHIEGKLVLFLQEPNPEEKIKGGIVKELTGNDRIYVRDLFKSPRSIQVKGKIVLVCNNIISIPDMDSALRRRTVVIPFISTFVRDEVCLENNTYMMNSGIETILEQSREAFLYILTQEYKIFKKLGLDIPEFINNTTQDYLDAYDYPLTFKKKYITSSEGSMYDIHEAYEMFKDWFTTNNPRRKIPTMEEFSKVLDTNSNGQLVNCMVTYQFGG